MPTAAQHIAMIVYPAWTYYRVRICLPNADPSLQADLACDQAQQLARIFANLDQAEAAFLTLIVRTITGQDPATDPQIVLAQESPPIKGPPGKILRQRPAMIVDME